VTFVFAFPEIPQEIYILRLPTQKTMRFSDKSLIQIFEFSASEILKPISQCHVYYLPEKVTMRLN